MELGTSTTIGSSPRVRGKRKSASRTSQFWRLIPACAGKTTPCFLPANRYTAHPRVCGENRIFPRATRTVEGSSPRVRGKPGYFYVEDRPKGLIPACAGKTTMRSLKTDARGAHPRVCGENYDDEIEYSPGWGSSPRVRGKRGADVLHRQPRRLIPACAGKTVRLV